MSSIRWAEFHKWSLVWVEFGDIKKEDANPTYGVNLGCEFSFRHMAIVVGYTTNDEHAVVIPITSYKEHDEKYKHNVIIEKSKYTYLVENDSTILVDKIRHIDKKLRVKKIVRSRIPNPLQRAIQKVMIKLFS